MFLKFVVNYHCLIRLLNLQCQHLDLLVRMATERGGAGGTIPVSDPIPDSPSPSRPRKHYRGEIAPRPCSPRIPDPRWSPAGRRHDWTARAGGRRVGAGVNRDRRANTRACSPAAPDAATAEVALGEEDEERRRRRIGRLGRGGTAEDEDLRRRRMVTSGGR